MSVKCVLRQILICGMCSNKMCREKPNKEVTESWFAFISVREAAMVLLELLNYGLL